MGSNIENSVVDFQGRVFGVQNLRVADASIMNPLVSGNPNWSCMVIGTVISNLIIKDSFK